MTKKYRVHDGNDASSYCDVEAFDKRRAAEEAAAQLFDSGDPFKEINVVVDGEVFEVTVEHEPTFHAGRPLRSEPPSTREDHCPGETGECPTWCHACYVERRDRREYEEVQRALRHVEEFISEEADND